MYVYNKQELADEDELFAMSYPGDSFTALDSLLSSVPGEVPRTSSGSRRLTGKRPRGEQLALDQSVLNDATEVILLDPNASNRKTKHKGSSASCTDIHADVPSVARRPEAAEVHAIASFEASRRSHRDCIDGRASSQQARAMVDGQGRPTLWPFCHSSSIFAGVLADG